MTANNALSPIAGTNGYQQQIAIDSSEPLDLSVSNASGRITIAGSDQPNVWVVVRRTDDHPTHGDDDEVAVSVSVEGNTILIRPDWQLASGLHGLAKRVKDQLQHGFKPDDWNISKLQFHTDLEYDIRVEIPRQLAEGSKIRAKSASGRVDISDATAQVTVASASGSVRLNELHGKTSAHSASGSVHVANVTGSLEVNTASGSVHINGGTAWTALRTVSGSVHLEDFTLRNARIVTVSGSVAGNAILDNAIDYSIETVSGSVKLGTSVPASGATSRLSFKTLSGSAKVDGDWVSQGKRSWSIGSGEPGPEIRVKTVSGSLRTSGRATDGLTLNPELLPVSPATDDDDEMATEPISMDESIRDGLEHARHATANLDQHLDKAFAWVKDAARTITPPTPPTQATPATPASPATPETPDWSWSSGSGNPPPAGAANPAGETAADDTEPLTSEGTGSVADSADASEPPDATDTSSLDTVDAERLHILEALERGEIDVDEALATIEREETRRA